MNCFHLKSTSGGTLDGVNVFRSFVLINYEPHFPSSISHPYLTKTSFMATSLWPERACPPHVDGRIPPPPPLTRDSDQAAARARLPDPGVKDGQTDGRRHRLTDTQRVQSMASSPAQGRGGGVSCFSDSFTSADCVIWIHNPSSGCLFHLSSFFLTVLRQ